MSFYYKQEFVSPDAVFAEVKEELSSYFASGAIDDVMFPKWTEHCLRRIRKSGFAIRQTVLQVKDHKACLPDDFQGVREAWACTRYHSNLYESATAQYYQQDCRIYVPSMDKCDPCEQLNGSCTTNFNVVHKVKGTYMFSFKRTFLLTPGNLEARKWCADGCPNLGASTAYTFDIHEGNMVTNFCDGDIHLTYYADPSEDGDQMIPQLWWVEDWIRKYIIYKCFMKLSNIITDETFNQVAHKKQEAKEDQAIAFIIAETELKKQTIYEKMRQIRVSYEQSDKYRLPGDLSYRGRYRP